jgi:hypothetical protein
LLAQIRARRAAICAITLIALAVRLHNVGFGLPSLYDPDEPIFMVIAAKLLSGRTLNPGWFGHPGSTTIYLIALIDMLVFAIGSAMGRFSGVAQFIHAAYADPSLLFLPARIAMTLLGTGCVALTYLLARRTGGTAAGLIAAALLALNGLHIAWSQVIRTDVHASLFMLASVLFAVRFAADGKLRDLAIASLLTGFALATKWPAATTALALIGALLYRVTVGVIGWPRALRLVALSGLLAVVGLFIASPFIFLDYPTVLSNLSGEARPFHLGHTGGGFVPNLISYLRVEAAPSMGWIGLLFAIIGMAIVALRNGPARLVVLPVALAFLAVICGQKLIWSRWLVPEMPFLCLFAAVAVVWSAERLNAAVPLLRRPVLLGALGTLVLVPTAAGAVRQARERENDTRAMAADWIVRNAPPGSAVVLEHLELRLRDRPYRFLFPMGSAGCLDALRLLQTGVRYEQLDQLRGGSPIVDLGGVRPDKAGTCRADFAILSYYDLYLNERARYPREVATYSMILAGGRTVALFRPQPGQTGGPIVRIVAMPQNHPK